jgi:uncharacterized membrane protein
MAEAVDRPMIPGNAGEIVMRRPAPASPQAITATVTIARPVEEVFGFYRDFTNLPRFLGDVMHVEQQNAATSRWTIQGPLGLRLYWTVRITAERANEFIRYETVATPALKTSWEIHFTPGRHGETEVRETLTAPFGGFGRAVLALLGKPPAEEVSANLQRLKQLLETGHVTDRRYAVPGKFAPPH